VNYSRVTVFCLLAVSLSAAAPPPKFSTVTPYPMPGADPTRTTGPLTTIDLNGDGLPDLLFLDPIAPSVILVELGDGHGGFRPPVSSPYPSSLTSASFITGDFNGDGITDLWLYAYPAMLIFFGNGDGTFLQGPSPALGLPVTLSEISLFPANLNGDKATDLIVVGVTAPSYRGAITSLFSYTFLNRGDGTFGNPISGPIRSYGAYEAPQVTVVDLDGDGISDVVAYPNVFSYVTDTINAYQVWLGKGDGTFTQLPAPPQSPVYYPMVAADFNHDGKPDLLGVSASSEVVLLGNGDGTFRVGGTTPSSAPFGSFVADVNGDGLPDIISSTSAGSDLQVALGDANFTFQNPIGFSTLAASVAGLADVNSDARADVVTSGNGSYGSPGYFHILFGQSAPVLKAPRISRVGVAPSLGVTADFNGDGKADVVLGAGYTGGLGFMEGNGDGSFAAPVSVPVNGTSSENAFLFSIVSADFNGDGKADLATLFELNGGSYLSAILLGNGDGTFRQTGDLTLPFSSGFPAVMKTDDLNGDGIADVYVIWQGTGTSYLYAFLGNGDGTFRPVNNTLNISTGSSEGLNAATLDSNGDLILFQTNTEQTEYLADVQLSNGDGTFRFGGFYFPSTPGTAAFAVGDLNNDGMPDLVAIQGYPHPVTLSVLFGSGNHTFAAAPVQIPLTFSEGVAIALADMNGDGNLDIVLQNEVLAGNGDGTFQPGVFLGFDPYCGCGAENGELAIADVNGDGKPDVVFPGVIEAILNVTPATGCALNAGAQISVTAGGFQYNHATQSFVQTVTLNNNGPQAVSGPILLALDGLSSNATLRSAGGVTQCDAPLGSPWITVAAGTLGAGQSESVALTFYDPTVQAIHYSARVLHGIGQP
jgi:hypothetical protein